jgi:hypothetical protein
MHVHRAVTVDPNLSMYPIALTPDPNLQGLLLRCLTDSSVGVANVLGDAAEHLPKDQLAHVLALRGMLACDVLQHCLQKRHSVDYGINRWDACWRL